MGGGGGTPNSLTVGFRKRNLVSDRWEGSPVAQSHEQGRLNRQKALLRCGPLTVYLHWLPCWEEASTVLKTANSSWLSAAVNTVCDANLWCTLRVPRSPKAFTPLGQERTTFEVKTLGGAGSNERSQKKPQKWQSSLFQKVGWVS